VSVVHLGGLDPLGDPGMVLQYHHVTWHERLVQLVCYLDCLPGGVLLRLRDDHQHVLLVEVEIPYVCEYGAELTDAIQFQELHLAVHYGLLCEWAGR
tara:strand:- start:1301 stop:1591 length:291 start_codon:yes stop_codon:yes gene_type:complete